MPEDTLPGRVGRFEIRRELGRGTMGVVFEAHDATLHRTVALKVIRLAFAASAKEREDFERRFLTEARAAAGLSHPGIVVVHEAGRDDASGMLYLALEHLMGHSLSEALAQRGRFEEKEALRIAAQVARALHYAHRRGVVHRDVKPANVMLLPDGQVKILDFGLAKVEAGHEHTAAGQFLGTPLFVSPEQALGQKVDGRSDLFSLGAILYTLLAGRRPFEGESLARILNRVAHQPPRPLRASGVAVSAAAEAVILRALAKDPDDRYPTGEAMAEDLEDVRADRPPRHQVSAAPASARPAGAAGRAGEGGGEKAGRDEGTVVAQPGELDALPELALEDAPAARPRRRMPLRALSLTLLLGGLAIYYWSIAGPERLAEVLAPLLRPPASPLVGGREEAERAFGALPDASVAAAPPVLEPMTPTIESAPMGQVPGDSLDSSIPPSPSEAAAPAEPSATLGPALTAEGLSNPVPSPAPAEAPAGSVAAEPDEDAAPVLLPDEDEPLAPPSGSDEPSPPAAAVPPAESSPTPSASLPRPTALPLPVSPPKARPASAELAIRLQHPLTRGTVRVWLDEKLVLRAALSSTVSRKILFFSFRNGRMRETLPVIPGRRRLKVEVRGKDGADSQQVVAEFRPGVQRRLEVREGSKPGRLDFVWRPSGTR